MRVPNSSVSATYQIDPPTGDNPLTISWLTGSTGLSTVVNWGADPSYGTRTHQVLVWITDTVTGVVLRRSLDVQVTTADPNENCTPGTYC